MIKAPAFIDALIRWRRNATIKPGDEIAFTYKDIEGTIRQFRGTAMTKPTNGIVMMAVHDTFVPTAQKFMMSAQILPVWAVRVNEITSVGSATAYQGETPK